jgi:hypothetical protein
MFSPVLDGLMAGLDPVLQLSVLIKQDIYKNW